MSVPPTVSARRWPRKRSAIQPPTTGSAYIKPLKIPKRVSAGLSSQANPPAARLAERNRASNETIE